MQENEFEKHLKRLMDGWHIPPSPTVWEKVSRKINKDRRKKWPFIFLLMLLLLTAGYITYHFSDNKKNNRLSYQKINIVKTTAASRAKDTLKAVLQTPAPDAVIPQQKGEKNKIALKEQSPAGNSITHPAPLHVEQSIQPLPAAYNNTAIEKTRRPEITGTQAINKRKFEDDLSLVTIKKANAFFMQHKTLEKNSFFQPSLNVQATGKNNVVINPIKPLPKNYRLPAWQWGITAIYGRSNITHELSADKSSPAADYIGTGNINGGLPDTVNKSGAGEPYTASGAYGFGAIVQRRVIKNGFLSAGINYIHLSAKSAVGTVVNSSVPVQYATGSGNYFINNYSRPGNTDTYINHYNFIEVPLYFQQDLFAGKKTGFSYNAGFSMRHLLSSNTLLYDASNAVYFSKNELVRKTQWQAMAGFDVKINTGRTNAFYIGPQFSYSLSKIFKSSANNSFHLFNYGVQAKFIFHKK